MTIVDVYTSKKRMDANFTIDNFIPDGDLCKTVWRQATWINFDQDVFTEAAYPQAKTEVAALWTSHSLYFAFRCKYTMLNVYDGEDPVKERWELWNRDVVEVFINPEPDRISHYYEFEVSPNNQWIDLEIDKSKDPFYDPVWASGFTHAVCVNAQHNYWTCEMCIPVAPMGAHEVLLGTEWRLNFYRADGPGDNSQRRLISWCSIPEGSTFHTPERFGLIRFVKSPQ
jgi:alpha-galactosidase